MNNETIIFVSSSDLGSFLNGANIRILGYDANQTDPGLTQFIPLGFQNLNWHVHERIEENAHILGFPTNSAGDQATLINENGLVGAVINDLDGVNLNDYTLNFGLKDTALIHHRNGPYGWPMWKQLRMSEHMISRWKSKNRLISVNDKNFINIDSNRTRNVGPELIINNDRNDLWSSETTKKLISVYTEPAVTFRSKPFEHFFAVEESLERAGFDINIKNTYGNNISTFANSELIQRYGLNTLVPNEIYEELKKIYIQGQMTPEDNPFKKFILLKYKESIFPRETNVALDRTRDRKLYVNQFWRTKNSDRVKSNQKNSQGHTIISQSIWGMDGRKDFLNNDENMYSKMFGVNGQGELQNNYTQYHGAVSQSSVPAALLYGRMVPMSSSTYHEAYTKLCFSSSLTAAALSGTTIEIATGSLPGDILYTFTIGDTSATEFIITDGDENASSLAFSQLLNARTSGSEHEPLYFTAIQSASAIPDLTTINIFASHVGALGNNFQIRLNTADASTNKIFISNSSGIVSNNTATNFEFGLKEPIYFGGDSRFGAYLSGSGQANKEPFYDSYQEFTNDLRPHSKNYSLIPEFKISEHMEKYVETNNGNFLTSNPGFLTLSGTLISSSLDTDFYKTYSTTDFLKHFELLRKDHEGLARPSQISLTCKALMKFHPYEGFYPAQRTLELGTLFSKSYGPICQKGGTQGNFRTLLQPFMAPGILFNSIKSGVAVDYPVYLSETEGDINEKKKAARTTDRPFYYEDLLGTQNLSSSVYSLGLTNNYVLAYDIGSVIAPERTLDRLPFDALIKPENYLNSDLLIDDEIHPSSSLNSYVTLTGVPGSLYTMAMNNFLASTVDFFLSDSKLTHFQSKKEEIYDGKKGFLIPESKKNKKYVMDVYLINGEQPDLGRILEDTVNPFIQTILSASTVSDYSSIPNKTDFYFNKSIYMYPHPESFGIPVSFSTFSEYANVTPPYHNGMAVARITFDPSGTAGVYSLNDIHEKMTIKYKRLSNSLVSLISGETLEKNFMQLSSSVDLIGVSKSNKKVYNKLGNRLINSQIEEDTSSPLIWNISTKWESPIFDFNYALTDPELSPGTMASESSGRNGLWHQYGVEITDEPNKGIYLKIADVNKFEQLSSSFSPTGFVFTDPNFDSNQSPLPNFSPLENVESLADLVGFEKDSKKIGKLGNAKIIKEAVVAIPYKLISGQMSFYSIPREFISFLEGDTSAISENEVKPGTSIQNMFNSMQNFVIPPQFDFVKNKEINPFAMYIFEFEHMLNRKDLGDIWQNLPPSSLMRVKDQKESTVTISHPLILEEFYGINNGTNGKINSETQWLVFKVKQKGAWDYKQKIEINNELPNETEKFQYNYNWPYDQFTMIEMVNLEAEVVFSPGVESISNVPLSSFEQELGQSSTTKNVLEKQEENKVSVTTTGVTI